MPQQPPVKLVPDTLFYSYFRNISRRELFISWAGVHGYTIQPGEVFKVPGDPRYNQGWHKSRPHAEIIKKMMEAGDIEFISSPSPFFDDKRNDGVSSVFVGGDEGPTVEISSVDAENYTATRVLPTDAPVVDYDDAEDVFNITWDAAENLDIHDKFILLETGPGITGTRQVDCAFDTHTDNLPTNGAGTYTFAYKILSRDGRTGVSEITEIVVPEPA
jgi:hypothetical protein